METIKLGTRCACANGCTVENCTTWEDVAKTPPLTHACGVRAVRLVKVYYSHERKPGIRDVRNVVPMCAACAEYHEAKGA